MCQLGLAVNTKRARISGLPTYKGLACYWYPVIQYYLSQDTG